MSQALRKLTGAINQSKCIVVFINQLREKVGVMFGNPETTTGGRSLKFYASMRIEVRRIESIKEAGDVVGNRVRAKFVKNKVAPPFTEAEFDILYSCGISYEGSVLDAALSRGVVEKRGSWLSFGDVQLGQGVLSSIEFLKANSAIVEEIALKTKASPSIAQMKARKVA
jgi:recombination protein RecA